MIAGVASNYSLLLLPFVSGAALGFLAADMASGVLHWFCDTYFESTTPFIGPMFIMAEVLIALGLKRDLKAVIDDAWAKPAE